MEIPFYNGEVPYLTTAQMIEVDRAMVEDYHIQLTQMMENAGRNLAHLARVRCLDGQPRGKTVVVLAGTGGNGGGAMAAARHLQNYGAVVLVILAKPAAELSGVPAQQLDILRQMGIPLYDASRLESLETIDLIIDGIIGYSLESAPQESAAEMIRWANQSTAPILALDVPSGVDAGSGTVYDPAIVAALTMTLALPKEGMRAPDAADKIGELYLADISVPPALYAGSGLRMVVEPLFASSDIIRLR
jgi:NAD(P)H-hydrate epimerase